MLDNRKEIQKHVREVFQSIQTKEDLLMLINFIYQKLHDGGKDNQITPISMKTLTYYAFYNISGENRYTTFSIKKKSGQLRTINAPAKELKTIQQCLNEIFQTYYTPNEYACGFIQNRNITDGAKLHTHQPYVYNIDLKDFFDTVTFARVKAVLAQPPFCLTQNREEIGYLITNLCCHPKKIKHIDSESNEWVERINCLPQGAPTSPILTNIVCQKLDKCLAGLARRFHAQYSRYADDITFSCHYNIFKNESDFNNELYRIIEIEQHLQINKEKTRLSASRKRQEVTGLVVNQKVNVSKRYVKQIRLWLHYWEKFGKARAQHFFIQQYVNQRGNVKPNTALLENVIGGKLDYLQMIVGRGNHCYKELKSRFDNLLQSNNKKTKQ